MWDEKKQRRLRSLLLKKERNKLSSQESVEIQSLTDERIRIEADALENSTRQITENAEQTRGSVREIEAQSRALEELVREQQSFLAEVSSLITQMETRRRGWHTRYKRVTGRPLDDPISPAGTR